jgi:hypothetical protein
MTFSHLSQVILHYSVVLQFFILNFMYGLHKMNLPWINTISKKTISQVQITIDNEI